MSYLHYPAAWALPVPMAQKLVALALTDHCDESGRCFPSVRALRLKCGTSQRTVQYALRRLEEAGHISSHERNGQSTYYTLHFLTSHSKVIPITHARAAKGGAPTAGGDAPNAQVGDAPNAPQGCKPCTHNQSGNLKKKNPTGISHADARGTHTFAEIKRLYPKRGGGQRWGDAERFLEARLREKHSPEVILDGVRRYAAYVRTEGIERTALVQQAATFLGNNRGFLEEWSPSVEKGFKDPFANCLGLDE